MKKVICTYCNQITDNPTSEHIIPKSIGGNIQPTNPFIIKTVCRSCNNFCGLFVDFDFSRNWFVSSSKFENAYNYVDIRHNPVLPLKYLGEIKELENEGKICDFWLSPGSDFVYHFHNPYPEITNLYPFVGIHPNQKTKIDLGYVFVFLKTTNSEWHRTILYSIVEQFKGALLYIGNGTTPDGGAFSNIHNDHIKVHKTLENFQTAEHKVEVVAGIHSGDRFLAKLGLGFAELYLKHEFFNTNDAKKLRSCLWSKEIKERQKLQLFGTNFFKPNDGKAEKLLGWKFGHVVGIFQIDGKIVLTVNFYYKNFATILITTNSELLKIDIGEGIIFVIAPGFQKALKLSSVEFLTHNLASNDFRHEELNELEKLIKKNTYKPPFRLDNLKDDE